RKRVRYSELDFEKVMHTRKRHSELYPELNHPTTKFHTIDRYNRDPTMSTFKVRARPYGAIGKWGLTAPTSTTPPHHSLLPPH
ncbi:unnamed protein product, partial [Coregonus sp. 'balchen']